MIILSDDQEEIFERVVLQGMAHIDAILDQPVARRSFQLLLPFKYVRLCFDAVLSNLALRSCTVRPVAADFRLLY